MTMASAHLVDVEVTRWDHCLRVETQGFRPRSFRFQCSVFSRRRPGWVPRIRRDIASR